MTSPVDEAPKKAPEIKEKPERKQTVWSKQERESCKEKYGCEIIIDDGALNALKNGKSLLAAGIRKVSGKFVKGDHVRILDKNNKEFARGLSSFTSDEISKIKGEHSNKISNLLGYVTKSEVIHKDDMVKI